MPLKLTVGDAARIAEETSNKNCSPDTIRDWERRGLLPATRTKSGVRLFEEEDVRRVARERAARTAGK